MIIRITALLLLLLTSFSCSIFSGKLAKKELAHMKNVAIYSDIGNKLQFRYAGATSLKNREQQVETTWDLDTLIEQQFLNSLKDDKRFTSVQITGSDIKKRPHFDQMITLKRNGAKIKDLLNMLRDKGFDSLIIIQGWKQVEDENVGAGFGIFYNNRLLINEQNFYLTARVRIYDTTTRKELSSVDFFKSPYIPLDKFPKRKSSPEWPASDLAAIKVILDEKIVTETKDSLQRIGLN